MRGGECIHYGLLLQLENTWSDLHLHVWNNYIVGQDTEEQREVVLDAGSLLTPVFPTNSEDMMIVWHLKQISLRTV